MDDAREEPEGQIRAAMRERDYEQAATLAIEQYGPELLALLRSQLRERDAADEAFAAFCEEFWRTLPNFEGRCSARTWAYKLARRVASRQSRAQGRARARDKLFPHMSQLSLAIETVRTETAPYLRTDIKDRFAELRALLSEDDQLLLILRVDRKLSWRELSEVLLDRDESPSELQLKTETARLRKRFQLAKERLRQLLVDAGMMEEDA